MWHSRLGCDSGATAEGGCATWVLEITLTPATAGCGTCCLSLPVTTANTTQCPRCAAPLDGDALVCNRCGALVYANELQQLAEQAQGLEQSNPPLAASIWRQCLPYLPADSVQHAAIVERAGALAAGFGAPGPRSTTRPSTVTSDDLTTFVLKTGGSMALSIALFAWSYDWQFAVAFVLLIFIHEMGHVIANWYFGLKQSAPIFLGYFGAVIFLRENRATRRWRESSGSPGRSRERSEPWAATYYICRRAHRSCWKRRHGDFSSMRGICCRSRRSMEDAPLPLFHRFSGSWGLSASWLSRGALFIQYHSVSFIGIMVLLWVFQSTLPRLRETLLNGGWRSEYYRTSMTTKIGMGLTYLALLAILIPQLLRFHPWSQL